ncbi:uncharacterized protein LOC143266066 isoform X2 [Megachile rotundata]|uniref:uncharacterized protein LOC143266066 isoform X2 n=1 Tax=Megachile rotundata TaxID=143995 RepID=UPI003FD66A26
MDSVDGRVSLNNLENGTNLALRAENLRGVLGELRKALRNERLNLHQEIEMTILQKFIARSNYESTRGNPGKYLMETEQTPIYFSKYHRIVHPNGDTLKMQHLACLGSSMYQRLIDELQDELNSLEQRLSTATSCSYKRKIYDLEAICSADLNRLKSRFVRSLQPFGNTIHSIEQLPSRRIKPTGCRCTTKKPPMEGACPRNTRCARSIATLRSKSTDVNSNHRWITLVHPQRYSDSEMYSKDYKSSDQRSLANSQIYTSDSESNWKLNNSITTIFSKATRNFF